MSCVLQFLCFVFFYFCLLCVPGVWVLCGCCLGFVCMCVCGFDLHVFFVVCLCVGWFYAPGTYVFGLAFWCLGVCVCVCVLCFGLFDFSVCRLCFLCAHVFGVFFFVCVCVSVSVFVFGVLYLGAFDMGFCV